MDHMEKTATLFQRQPGIDQRECRASGAGSEIYIPGPYSCL